MIPYYDIFPYYEQPPELTAEDEEILDRIWDRIVFNDEVRNEPDGVSSDWPQPN